MSRSISTRGYKDQVGINGLVSVFVSIIKNSQTLQATLTLTAPHTPFVPSCIHNSHFFPTDCSRVALGTTHILSQVYVCVQTHPLAHTHTHTLALAPFLGVSNILVFSFFYSFHSFLSALFYKLISVKYFVTNW